jgi:hypothetical protein
MNIIEDNLSTIILQPFYFGKNFDCIMKGTIGNDGLPAITRQVGLVGCCYKIYGNIARF